MRLKRGGVLWRFLRDYGYDNWQLERGISLCKAFWSLVLGAPFVYALRGLRMWGAWVFRPIDPEHGTGVRDVMRAFMRSMTFPASVSVVMYLASGLYPSIRGYVGLPFVVVIGLWIGVPTVVFGSYGCWALYRSMKEGLADNLAVSEMEAVIGGGLRAIKGRVCPIIRFDDGREGMVVEGGSTNV